MRVFAWGMNAALAAEIRDNSDIYWMVRAGLPETAACDPTEVQGMNILADERSGVIHRIWLILIVLGLWINYLSSPISANNASSVKSRPCAAASEKAPASSCD